jgi:diacylglycerol O-acyltransferase
MSPAPQWPDRMNAIDALFWSLDTLPELRSTTGALLLLERPPAAGRVREEFERLTVALPRLRQRVVEVPFNLAPPEWIDDPEFDLDYHLRSVGVPFPGGMAELLAELGPLYASPLDRDRPLWEAYFAEGLVDGRAAVFIKMHHCMMDGVGGTAILKDLLGERREQEPAPPAPSVPPRSTEPGARLARAVLHNAGERVALARTMAGTLLAAALHPRDTLRQLSTGVRQMTGFSRELAVPRAESPLHHHRSLSRQLSTFDMQLAEIDAARATLEATNNDVVLTVVCGALHRWHTSRGADVKELRALVPVNVRDAADPSGGNRIALLAVGLPIGEPNPLRRLRLIQERMGNVKADRRATLYPIMARLLAALPKALAAPVGRQQMQRTNFVCTNVPGPSRTCYLAGEAVERMYAFAPLVGDHPVAIALFRYRDMVHVGLDVDPLAMPDLPHFRDALAESYAEVMNVGRRGDAAIPQRA